MKILQDEKDNITVNFDINEEKTLFAIIGAAINYRPKYERKHTYNWCFVSDYTYHGSGYSIALCMALGVDPYGYKWEKENKQ